MTPLSDETADLALTLLDNSLTQIRVGQGDSWPHPRTHPVEAALAEERSQAIIAIAIGEGTR